MFRHFPTNQEKERHDATPKEATLKETARKEEEEKPVFEMSVWDFGGQEEYYNNHHHFLSVRTVFLVCWKMSEHEQGLKGIEFWLKSLRFHLPKPKEEQENEIPKEYSIIIVGTHSDQFKGNWTEYKKKIEEIYEQIGFKFPIHEEEKVLV